jgi:hypothetical protein
MEETNKKLNENKYSIKKQIEEAIMFINLDHIHPHISELG